MAADMLKVEAVYAGYQPGIDILRGISISTKSNPVTVLVGPNGAGKSTLLKTIFGMIKPRDGVIQFEGEEIAGHQSHELKLRGISYISQGLNFFAGLTVEQNLRVGAWTIRRDKALVGKRIEEVLDLFPSLRQLARIRAGNLSGGQARQLCIAKELLNHPRLMLVDEPTVGVSPKIADEVYEFLLQCRSILNATILLVDQRIEPAVAIADYVYVLNLGAVYAEGPRSDFDITKIREVMRQCLAG